MGAEIDDIVNSFSDMGAITDEDANVFWEAVNDLNADQETTYQEVPVYNGPPPAPMPSPEKPQDPVSRLLQSVRYVTHDVNDGKLLHNPTADTIVRELLVMNPDKFESWVQYLVFRQTRGADLVTMKTVTGSVVDLGNHIQKEHVMLGYTGECWLMAEHLTGLKPEEAILVWEQHPKLKNLPRTNAYPWVERRSFTGSNAVAARMFCVVRTVLARDTARIDKMHNFIMGCTTLPPEFDKKELRTLDSANMVVYVSLRANNNFVKNIFRAGQ